ncbi:MAG TPA: O-methyltransferase [Devosia sp.]|jgi:hypothetical protein|uniref:O-methyltransferase n=1 Tax=Devosia sp. TaxID=1871048 RepID=UPI002DDCB71B|nr:O-methyltransferase [Devosia sp.]HEV2517825.1 O-methyltransferase [Devosia sp.]
MGGSTVPYALRQNKFVDRRIYIDLLSRVERYFTVDDHVYISMGGATLEDHRLAHAELGMNRLLSFDSETWVVARQRFNKPYDYIKVIQSTSTDLISNFSHTLEENGFGAAPNVAMWLDFTSPGEIGQQVREFNQLLDLLQPHDILRITVNASASAIYRPEKVDGRAEREDEFKPKRLKKLQERLGDYLPTDAAPDDMVDSNLGKVLAQSLEKAAKEAFPASSKLIAVPLSLVRYADGQQMLSATTVILDRGEVDAFLEKTKAKAWPFYSATWTDIHLISVPEFTMRERMLIGSKVSGASEGDICTELGFLFNNDKGDAEEYIRQYKRYYRFYPHFHHIVV